MSHWKSSGLAIFAVVCLLGKTTGSAHAQCNSFGTLCAAEWNGGSAINLGGLPGSTGGTQAYDINDVGQAVGVSFVRGSAFATEWSGGSAINLGGLPLPGSTGSFTSSVAYGINKAGQVVGQSGVETATEWIGDSVINLGGLPGSTGSNALSINDVGQAVGYSFTVVSGVGVVEQATEWIGDSVIELPGLPSYLARERIALLRAH